MQDKAPYQIILEYIKNNLSKLHYITANLSQKWHRNFLFYPF